MRTEKKVAALIDNLARLTQIVIFCLLIFLSNTSAQEENSECRTDCQCEPPPNKVPAELVSGQILTRSFQMDESSAHFYQIKLQAAQFIRVRIEQKGIDVYACVCKTGQKIDSPTGTTGAEEFSFVSESEQNFTFSIKPFENTGGDYSVIIEELRTAAPPDISLTAAENTYRNAANLRLENCPSAFEQFQTAEIEYRNLSCPDCAHRLGEILYRLGGYAAASGKQTEAIRYFEDSLRTFTRLPAGDSQNLEWRWLALTDLGLALTRTGDFTTAKSQLEEAKSLMQPRLTAEIQPDYARLLNIYANLLIEIGEPSLALLQITEGLQNKPNENVRASLLLNQGLAEDNLGNTLSALKSYETAYRLSSNQADKARVLINTGIIRERAGELEAAQSDFEEALKIAGSVPLEEVQAHAERRLGIFYLNAYGNSKIQEARYKLNLALQLFVKLKNEFEAEKTKVYLAATFYEAEDYAAAGRQYQDALEQLKCNLSKTAAQSPPTALCGLIYNNLGAVYYRQKDIQNARVNFVKSLELRRESADLNGQAEANFNLGVVEAHAAASAPAKVFNYFETARTFYRDNHDRRSEAAVLFEMTLAARKSSPAEAVAYLRAALQNFGELNRYLRTDDLRLSVNAEASDYWKLYLELTLDEKTKSAQILGLQLSERTHAESLRQNLQETGVRLEAAAVPQCGQSSKDLTRYADISREHAEKVEKLKKGQLSEIQKSSIKNELESLEKESAERENKLKNLCPKFSSLAFSTIPEMGKITEIENFQSLLDDHTAILEYTFGAGDSSYLWKITRREISFYRLPGGDSISRQTRLVRAMLTDKERFFRPLDAKYQTEVLSLSAMILPVSLVESLTSQTKLAVIADGELLNLPFAILPVGTPRKLLLEKFEISYLPSLAVLSELRENNKSNNSVSPDRRLALFSSPVFSQTDNGFPGSTKTVLSPTAACADCLNFEPLYFIRENDCRLVDIFLGSKSEMLNNQASGGCACQSGNCGAGDKILWKRVREATKQNFLTARLADFTDIIILTHGVYNAKKSPSGAEQSGLYFSYFAENGDPLKPDEYLLKPDDIYRLKLSRSLVTLGACETSLGANVKGEGLLNMTRGFIWAGSRGVTATLWSVEEEATMNAILRMNQTMFAENLSPAAALRKAQLEAFKQNNDPRRWAGIVFYGDLMF